MPYVNISWIFPEECKYFVLHFTEAKNYVINLMLKGINNSDDIGNLNDDELQLPDWYNETKFKR